VKIGHMVAGSWIYADFFKWIGNPYKNKAWEYLLAARRELEALSSSGAPIDPMAFKQMYICEGSDWFWWYGDRQRQFDELFRLHLSNFYRLIHKEIPPYLNVPIEP
jgi:alpha-amylase/alpha-mannosidase (GH57 family)